MGARRASAKGGTRGAHVALLRGINVGGKNKLPMRALVEVFEAAGCAAVETYIQSGNVVFEAAPSLAAELPRRLEAAIEEAFGFRVPVVLRTAPELARVAESNPYLRAGADPEHLHVMFLGASPRADAISALDPARSPPDEFVVLGREIFLRCPNGLGRSKLTNAYFDARLGAVSTCRNWRTLLKLIELATR